MAKDNVPFHSVIFPGIMLAVNKNHTTVTNIMATEYLNYEDGKFSKSRVIGVFGNDAQETGIPADVWRYYLASARPEGQDSSFSWADLVARNNFELLNNLGNFINRALVFAEKNFNSTISTIAATEDEYHVLALINREIHDYVQAMEKAKLRDGLRHVLAISRHGNQYLQVQQPWVLLKGSDDQKQRAGSIISFSCNIACLLATLLFPFMPETARTIWAQLGTQRHYLDVEKPVIQLYLKPGHKIGQPAPLFAKIEAARLEELKKRYGGSQSAKPEQPTAAVLKTVPEVEAAITAQGDKVRSLKAAGTEKALVQVEVKVLLDLKKQLSELQLAGPKVANGEAKAAAPVPASAAAAPDNSLAIKDLEAQITKQGETVRQLKAGGDKSVWQPEVEKLLALKKQLTALGGAPAPAPAAKSASKNKKKK